MYFRVEYIQNKNQLQNKTENHKKRQTSKRKELQNHISSVVSYSLKEIETERERGK